MQFVREQGIVGLAIGFILGGSTSRVVSSFVNDVIQPLVGLAFGSVDGLKSVQIGPVMAGNFLSNVIDFILLAAIVYFVFKGLKLDRLDAKKEKVS